MKIYRYVTQEELEMMRENSPSLGREFPVKLHCNDFLYQDGVKYLHFYKHKEDIRHIKEIYKGNSKTYYICTFKAPFKELLFKGGRGYYQEKDGKVAFVKEFAIPVKEFDSKWIQQVEEDRDI